MSVIKERTLSVAAAAIRSTRMRPVSFSPPNTALPGRNFITSQMYRQEFRQMAAPATVRSCNGTMEERFHPARMQVILPAFCNINNKTLVRSQQQFNQVSADGRTV